METELKNTTSIFSGQTFREKVENDLDGDVWVIQMKDLDSSYMSIAQTPNFTKKVNVSAKQLLQDGDILFLAKGNNNKAFVYDEGRPAVAVSLFFVLRTDPSKLLPDYLAWYLNQKDTQNYLKSTREGATVSSIKKSTLETLPIPLPSLKEQEFIGKIHSLHLRELKISTDLTEKRNTLIDSLLISRVK